jgi:hypothetical protein
MLKVYIDTNIFKFSATQLPRLLPRKQVLDWGGTIHEVTIHDFVKINPNNFIKNPDLKSEADLLPKLAEMGKFGRIKYVINMETIFESWGIPKMDSETGRFFGAPYETVTAPIEYSRVCFRFDLDPSEMQFKFISSIRHKRFDELQKMTGAYQGKGKLARNQLLDAFHLWCAEHNECDYFLTMDFKLIKMLSNKLQSLKVVKPSDLLVALNN